MQASVSVRGRVSQAEELWYDLSRRAAFIDGFKAVARVDEDWPARGASLLWDTHPGGRGRIAERVTAYEARAGQTAEIEDEQVTATQQVAFAPAGEDLVAISLQLDYELKDRRLIVVDWLFIRRAQRESLRRTLNRFAVELVAERSL